jgi:putative phosphoribosyl transferase
MVQASHLPLGQRQPPAFGGAATPTIVRIAPLELEAELRLPVQANGLIIFAPCGGSSRKSRRDQFVARALEQRGLGSLLCDLLTPAEHRQDALDQRLCHDVRFLARRIGMINDWLCAQPFAGSLPIGYFATRAGAAAAIVAAAERVTLVRALVSQGGRPDLAGAALPRLCAPTLLLIDDDDRAIRVANEGARRRMSSAELVVLPKVHEPGTLDTVATLAGDWFLQHLASAGDSAPDSAPLRAMTFDEGNDDASFARNSTAAHRLQAAREDSKTLT